MFRRKEESLFDAPTDAAYAPDAPVDTATAAAPVSAPVSTTASNSSTNTSSSGSNTSGSATSSSGGISRPLPDARPATTQTSFRPNTSSEITRNRMPETKQVAAPAVTTTTDKSGKPGRRVLTVGNDILLKGEIATCDRLVIEGKVDATLNDVHTVEISENGSFKGSAQIEDAEISGLFEGDLVVRNRLVIYATGKVRGKITYGEIEIERGGELTGEIKTISTAGQPSNSRPSRSTAPQKEAVAA